MSRRPNVIKSEQFCSNIPATLKARLDLFLFSPAEGRIPLGRHAEWLSSRITEFFEWRQLNLQQFDLPPGYFVRGPKEMIEALETKLKGKSS